MRKIKITKKEKRKVEGLIWNPSNISSINTMLQWNNKGGKFTRGEKFIHGGEKNFTGMGAKEKWERKKKAKPKKPISNAAAALPLS
jgi:hypothetical protein